MRYALLILLMFLGPTHLLAQQYIAFEHDTIHWTLSDDSLVLHTGDAREAHVELLTQDGSKVHYQVEHGYIVSCKMYNKDGTLTTEISYKEGKRHGTFRNWTDDGVPLIRGQYEDGMESGEWIYFRKNGKRQLSGTFLPDAEAQLDGLEFIEYTIDDELGEHWFVASMAFQHSPPHGRWIFYDVNGKVAGIIDFEKGKVKGLHFGDVE
jgi:antitoxin component YwqK of YwqJK toxin-antitoxin module